MLAKTQAISVTQQDRPTNAAQGSKDKDVTEINGQRIQQCQDNFPIYSPTKKQSSMHFKLCQKHVSTEAGDTTNHNGRPQWFLQCSDLSQQMKKHTDIMNAMAYFSVKDMIPARAIKMFHLTSRLNRVTLVTNSQAINISLRWHQLYT